ncbi:hypothetical protein AB0L67_41465, partial [Streptomyces flaveolus]|uniref:hypothetical protein n=1 Tax=Streptomyces flaveolus TaxID=67297 RepID=UPI003444CB07
MPMADDDVLAEQIASHEFEERERRPVLPPKAGPFAQRLHNSLVRDGTLNSGLGSQAQQALRAKGFTLEAVADGRMGLASDTLRVGENQPMTDDVLARQIADHAFESRGGRPVLPPAAGSFAQRLHNSLVRDGALHSGLGSQAQQALSEKGFTLEAVADGRMGLASDTPRTAYKPPPMTDDVLARWIAGHEFESRGGRPVLPPAAGPFAQRLHGALVRTGARSLRSGLGSLAQQALRAKGFTLEAVAGGKRGPRMGLASGTLRAGRTGQRVRQGGGGPGVAAAAFLPVAGP